MFTHRLAEQPAQEPHIVMQPMVAFPRLGLLRRGGRGNGGGVSGGGGGSVVFDIHEVSRSLAKPAGGSFPIADFAPGRTRGGEAGRRGLASGVEFDEKASDRFQHQGRRRYNRHSSRNLRSRAHVRPVLAKYF